MTGAVKGMSPRMMALYRLITLAWTAILLVVVLPIVLIGAATVWLFQVLFLVITGDHAWQQGRSGDIVGNTLTWIFTDNLNRALMTGKRDSVKPKLLPGWLR